MIGVQFTKIRPGSLREESSVTQSDSQQFAKFASSLLLRLDAIEASKAGRAAPTLRSG